MGKKEGEVEDKKEKEKEKEGGNLLGSPTFQELENGRFKCVETGHELPAHARESYAQSKHCRLGLIDAALAHNKPPLNMFRQDPLSSSKLICKLTGFTINKSEEHIWKHINGKRFLNMLEKKETEKQRPGGMVAEQTPEKVSESKVDGLKEKKKKKKKKKNVSKIVSEIRDSSEKDSDLEEADFWMPRVGERWDFDDGGDRLGSGSDSGTENDDADKEEVNEAAGELSKRTKRMSMEIGPSNFGSRKKKKKTTST